jgi:D-3-phosphoglycerate dehydrogenase
MRILVTAPYNEKGQEILAAKLGEVVYRPWKDHGRAFNEEELINLITETKADALITEHDHVTAKVIETHPRLQFIGVCRGTPSNVSVDTAKRLGIPVFHTPARNAQAVAELFLATVIDLMRNTWAGVKWLSDENWDAGAHTSYLQFKGNELAGKTIGMVGFGAVGQRIAHMVENFPCYIKFYDPYVENYKEGYVKASLEEVFETCDVVSIHLPVNDSTIGMINKDLISRMKQDAIFVNTARASVVRREDLLYALENNLIRGAVLDVFDHEPPDELDYRIIHLPNVLATPHIAGATHEVEDHHVNIMNNSILNWFAQENLVSGS